VYKDAKNDLVRSLAKFDKSMQDAGLLLIKRVDDNVGIILEKQEGITSEDIFADISSWNETENPELVVPRAVQ
jgi:hypothetical protein